MLNPGAASSGRLRAVWWLSPLAAALLFTVGVAAGDSRLAVGRAGSSLSVSFDLQPTQTGDLGTRLRGAEPVSVTWQIDVRREVPLWLDQGVQRFRLEVTARRTAQADVFMIERTLNRRVLGQPSLASLDEVYRALTSFSNVELPHAAPPESHERYRLAISARVRGGGEAKIDTAELVRTVIE